jgi:superfamily II DNA/RNA helicase
MLHISRLFEQQSQMSKVQPAKLLQTLAFLLPVMTMALQRLEQRVFSKERRDDFGPEAVIVAPSRELAMQIVHAAQKLLPQQAWPLVQQAIGGANMARQLDSMRKNKPLVVVGTPGRLAEHSRVGSLRTHKTAAVVLDEVDQLLCSQFQADLIRVMQHLGSRLEDGPQVVRTALHRHRHARGADGK